MDRKGKFSTARVMLPLLLVLVLLAAAMAEATQRVKPKDADIEQFHATAKAMLESIPKQIPGAAATWYGSDVEVPPSAVDLLHPNTIISRQYSETRPGGAMTRSAQLLIVHCRDARDLEGHYPPRCYPSQGWTQLSAQEKAWTLPARTAPGGSSPAMTVDGMIYEFSQTIGVDGSHVLVYNFFLIPGSNQTLRDIDAVYSVGEDYQRRYWGAAEVQVVSSDLSVDDLHDATMDLLGPYVNIWRFLQSGGIK